MKKTSFFLLALFGIWVSFTSLASIDALNFSSAQQETDYHQLTQQLRCPQCQNNNIADSNATIAVDMRGKVFELLQEGKSKQDIVDYMVARYGNFVTYDPPLTVATILLWLTPLALILAGLAFVLRRKGQKRADDFSAVFDEQAQQRLQSLLKNKE